MLRDRPIKLALSRPIINVNCPVSLSALKGDRTSFEGTLSVLPSLFLVPPVVQPASGDARKRRTAIISFNSAESVNSF